MQREEELEFWIDVNLPPSLATWLNATFGVAAKSFSDLSLLTAPDNFVFRLAAQATHTIVITTKDIDYLELTTPKNRPKILLISTGNISNEKLRQVFLKAFPQALEQFSDQNTFIVEITN